MFLQNRFYSSQATLVMLLQSRSSKAHKQGWLRYLKVVLVKLTSKAAYVFAKSVL
jgi:hypothetical protein